MNNLSKQHFGQHASRPGWIVLIWLWLSAVLVESLLTPRFMMTMKICSFDEQIYLIQSFCFPNMADLRSHIAWKRLTDRMVFFTTSSSRKIYNTVCPKSKHLKVFSFYQNLVLQGFAPFSDVESIFDRYWWGSLLLGWLKVEENLDDETWGNKWGKSYWKVQVQSRKIGGFRASKTSR